MYQYRRPQKPEKPKIPKILYLVLAVILLVSTGVIINYVYEGFRYTHGAHSLGVHAQTSTYEATPAPSLAPTISPTAPSPEPTYNTTPEPTPESEPETTPPPRIPRQEFLDLRTEYNNDDIVGHVWIPDTNINYLVAQGTDNDFYLYHDLRGRRFLGGSIYLDYLADIHNPGDHNWVLYGHNMGNGTMFHNVRHFMNYDFFMNNRYIHFSTIYADYVFEVFSVYVAHVSFYYTWNYFEDWAGWINQFKELSMFDASVTVTSDDRIITLSTCENIYRNNRIVVHGVLISETFPHLETY
ncbi:MAG: class B sortase [Defluviitaleaceae bacterium]|nr:class B sortase [Defluviitaleaceae bacterium]